MSSISNGSLKRCFPGIEATARQAAHKYVLPWRLQDLKKAGLEGIKNAANAGRYDERLGLPFERQAARWIEEAADNEAKRLLASATAGEASEPSNDQIRLALTTFSAQEWRDLIAKFGQNDVDALRTYLDANKDPLQNWLGRAKYIAILNQETQRGLILSLQRPLRMTAITDAMWAHHIYNDARRRNIAGEPRPSVKRSWAEVGGLNNISESLSAQGHKVTPYQVKKILERVEQTPFEEFDGDYHEYLRWATDPKAHENYLRLKKTCKRPRRDPDPFFSQRH